MCVTIKMNHRRRARSKSVSLSLSWDIKDLNINLIFLSHTWSGLVGECGSPGVGERGRHDLEVMTAV